MHSETGILSGPVRSAFDALNEHEVDYVVLRGYLPVSALGDSPDIDVYIPPRQIGRALPLLRAAGWLERRWQTGRFPHVFLDHLGDLNRFATVFDVVTGLNFGRRLHELSDPQAVLRSNRMMHDVRVPSPWHGLFLLTLHSLLDKERLLPRHLDRIERHWNDCRTSGLPASDLSADFGPEVPRLCTDLAETVSENPRTSLEPFRERARSLPCLRPRPLSAAWHRSIVRLREWRRRPVRIAVIGLDGAGKSTLIETFRRKAGVPAGSGYLGDNQYLNPIMRALVDKIRVLSKDEARKDGRVIRLLDALRLFLWPTEWFLRVRRAEAGRMLAFYDRYPVPGLEPEAAPRASRLGFVRRRIKAIGRRVLPDPDIVLFFDGDAKVLWPRKKEHPLQVFVETQAQYRRVVGGLTCESYTIDTTRPLEETWAELVRVLAGSPILRRVLYSTDANERLDDGGASRVD